jgi:hypothetical protein
MGAVLIFREPLRTVEISIFNGYAGGLETR